jgi:hypothetical protein
MLIGGLAGIAGLGCTERTTGPTPDSGTRADARPGGDDAAVDAPTAIDAPIPIDAPITIDAPLVADAPVDAPPPCAVGEMRACYSGAPAHAGVGVCSLGSETCVDRGEFGAEWGPCTGSGLPETETCDGEDDDCDGAVDDGVCTPGAGCPSQPVVWHLPPGTTGGPACITTGGGTCEGVSDPSCADGATCLTRDPTCVAPDVHQATLRCDDGSYVNDCYCTVIARCEDGVLTVTGFTW